jgi:NAD dependent epimerase/dehydratase family enzyme
MGTGSVGAALATAPMLANDQIAALSQQQLQQLMAEPVVMDQTATAEQQLLQRDLINNLQGEALSPGTMFQMQGIESTLGRIDPSLDPYGIMRGGALR